MHCSLMAARIVVLFGSNLGTQISVGLIRYFRKRRKTHCMRLKCPHCLYWARWIMKLAPLSLISQIMFGLLIKAYLQSLPGKHLLFFNFIL